jgi:hypothetical protein
VPEGCAFERQQQVATADGQSFPALLNYNSRVFHPNNGTAIWPMAVRSDSGRVVHTGPETQAPDPESGGMFGMFSISVV